MTDGVIKRYELTRTRDVLYDCISSNITDPLPTAEKRVAKSHWIKAGFPTKVGKLGTPAPEGWKFPIIVIPYSELDDENRVLDGSKSLITHSIPIEVHSRTRVQANELAEEIRNILKVTTQDDLKKASLHGPDVISTTHDSDFIGGNKYYTVTIDYEFKRFD